MQTIKKGVKISVAVLGLVVFMFCYGCPIQNWFGIPCPGCNMTTALYYLILGEIKTALFYHPLVLLLLLVCILEVGLYYTYKRWDTKYSKIILMLFVGMLLIVYVYRMVSIFPQKPMVYVQENMLEKIKMLFF